MGLSIERAPSISRPAMGRPPLRVGIIGAGLMGRWHAVASRRAGGQIAAIMDTDTEAARRLAGRLHTTSFTDLEQMLAAGALDVVHICTPTLTHAVIATAVFERGIHVMVEKPVAESVTVVDGLLRQAAARRLLLCPTYQFAFQDGVRQAQAWLPRIGELLHFDAVFCSAGAVGRSSAEMDQVVSEILPHPLALLRALTPEGVLPAEWTVMQPRAGELHAMTQLGGTAVRLAVSMSARPTVSALRLAGSRGTIHVNLFHGYAILQSGRVSRLKKIADPFTLALAQLWAASTNLGRRGFRGEPAYPGLQQIVGAFYHAIATGGEAPIPAAATLEIERVRERISADVETAARARG